MTATQAQLIQQEEPLVVNGLRPPAFTGKGKMSDHPIEITPAMSEIFLANVPDYQRRLIKKFVERYARDMKDGNWRVTGDSPIIISSTGKVLNGQHRLAACVLAGVSFYAYILTGADEADYPYMDQGIVRKINTMLHITQSERIGSAGSGPLLSRVARMVFAYLHGLSKKPNDLSLSLSSLNKLNEEYPNIFVAVELVQDHIFGRHILMSSRATIAYLVLLLLEAKSELVMDFVEKLAKGNDLSADDPILRLRNRFLEDRAKGNWKQRMLTELAGIKVINALIKGEPMNKLSIRKDESPVVIGFPPLTHQSDFALAP